MKWSRAFVDGAPRTAADRFWEKVEKRGDDECWPWLGTTWKDRGRFSLDGSQMGAPRAAAILQGMEVAPGTEVCHRCDNPKCVNPRHLFLGSHRDNIRDAQSKGRLRGQSQTHCLRGHELSADNLYFRADGCWRECRTCRSLRGKKRRGLRRALGLEG